MKDQKPTPESTKAEEKDKTAPKKPEMPKEIGGQEGPEPTRFGDWEKGGRCTDF